MRECRHTACLLDKIKQRDAAVFHLQKICGFGLEELLKFDNMRRAVLLICQMLHDQLLVQYVFKYFVGLVVVDGD